MVVWLKRKRKKGREGGGEKRRRVKRAWSERESKRKKIDGNFLLFSFPTPHLSLSLSHLRGTGEEARFVCALCFRSVCLLVKSKESSTRGRATEERKRRRCKLARRFRRRLRRRQRQHRRRRAASPSQRQHSGPRNSPRGDASLRLHRPMHRSGAQRAPRGRMRRRNRAVFVAVVARR